ncbi:unnamed protein product, partial [Strongylus vulgaris]
FEYVKAEVLKNDCVEDVIRADNRGYLTVISLNPMVQQGIKEEKDWKAARKTHYDMGMNYVEIGVAARTLPRIIDGGKMKVGVRMRFRHTRKTGFEPVGTPTVYWASHKCHAKRIEQMCEMCYYNRLLTE